MGEMFLISPSSLPSSPCGAKEMIEGGMTGETRERYGRDDGRDKISRNPLFKGVSGV